MAAIFLWVILPYIVGTIMVLGCLYRFAFRQLSWAAPSTEIYGGKKALSIGSMLFHYGIIAAFLGHLMMIIPMSFYRSIGINDALYHLFAMIAGGIAGWCVCIGLVILLVRKVALPRSRAHATFADFFSVIMVLIVAALGTYLTTIYDVFTLEYEYRATVGPWFRSLFVFQPRYDLMNSIPTIFKVHVVASFLLFASIPFTRLVHLFSFPIRFPWRAPEQYRSRSNYKR